MRDCIDAFLFVFNFRLSNTAFAQLKISSLMLTTTKIARHECLKFQLIPLLPSSEMKPSKISASVSQNSFFAFRLPSEICRAFLLRWRGSVNLNANRKKEIKNPYSTEYTKRKVSFFPSSLASFHISLRFSKYSGPRFRVRDF